MIKLKSMQCQNNDFGQSGQLVLMDAKRHYSFFFDNAGVEILVSDYTDINAKPTLHKRFRAEGIGETS